MSTMKVRGEDLKPGDVIVRFGKTKTVSFVGINNRGNYIRVEYVGEPRKHGDAIKKIEEFDVERPGEES